MQRNAIALHGRFVLPRDPEEGGQVSPRVVSLNMEAAALGYTLSSAAGQALSRLGEAEFLRFRADFLSALVGLSGESGDYNVLFAGFPHSTPDQRAYLLQRVRGFLLRGGVEGAHSARLVFSSGGTVMMGSGEVFSTRDFGVDPVTQFALPGVRAQENVRSEHVRLAPLKVLEAAGPSLASEWVSEYLSRGSSLSAQERELIEELRGLPVRPARPGRVFRETFPILYSFHGGDRDYIRSLMSGATDVLRLACWMSDRAGDLSLAEPTKFRLSGAERRELLRLLDGVGEGAAEDMLRRRERWLRLGERLNPGTAENRRRFPTAARAFDLLRNEPRAIPSLNRAVEAGLRPGADHALLAAALEALSQRPGEVVRRIEWMLRRAGAEALPFVGQALERANPRMLSKLSVHLKERVADLRAGVNTSSRAFPIKGKSNRFKVVQDTRPAMDPDMLGAVLEAIDEEMEARLSALPPLGRVWVDPELFHRVLPWNRRGDSSASARVDKGSAYPADESPVLRLFAWWKGNFDLDLSANLYDADWDRLESVGFYNLHDRDRVFVHSGDVQNAPEGAAEFIDVDRERLRRRYPTARWLVMSLHSFRGEGFDTFPAHCGFMGRDSLRSGRRFEPSEVALRFELNAPATTIAMGVWDVAENRFIPADLALGSHRHSSALRGSDALAEAGRRVAEARTRGLTLGAIAMAHARARGVVVSDPLDADLSLGPASFGPEQAERWVDEAVPLEHHPRRDGFPVPR